MADSGRSAGSESAAFRHFPLAFGAPGQAYTVARASVSRSFGAEVRAAASRSGAATARRARYICEAPDKNKAAKRALDGFAVGVGPDGGRPVR
jgi:hypothetical protein